MRKIYTKGGDKGTTQFLSGKRVPKYHIRVEAYGTVDELTSNVGYLRSLDLPTDLKIELLEFQQILFDISGLLACDQGKHMRLLNPVKNSSIEQIEKAIDRMTDQLPPLTKFIIPGGQPEVAFGHICRTVTRRAERAIVRLADSEEVNENIIIFINRLSDYFYTLSRFISKIKNFEQPTAN